MSDSTNKEKTLPTSAFLIVNSEVFPLESALINIGRKLDNHIVIHDPRISRTHAQLRALEGQFVLLDLNSSGGTKINGKSITKSVLYSGDLISLAGVEVKFVQDAPKMITRAMDRTGPLNKLSFEDPPTQIISRDDSLKSDN